MKSALRRWTLRLPWRQSEPESACFPAPLITHSIALAQISYPSLPAVGPACREQPSTDP